MTPQQGFILTRHWRDTAEGTQIELWLATDAGPRLVRLPVQPSVAFLPVQHQEQARRLLEDEAGVEIKPLALRDFDQRPVAGLYCRQYGQLQRVETVLRQAGIELFEADIRPMSAT